MKRSKRHSRRVGSPPREKKGRECCCKHTHLAKKRVGESGEELNTELQDEKMQERVKNIATEFKIFGG